MCGYYGVALDIGLKHATTNTQFGSSVARQVRAQLGLGPAYLSWPWRTVHLVNLFCAPLSAGDFCPARRGLALLYSRAYMNVSLLFHLHSFFFVFCLA